MDGARIAADGEPLTLTDGRTVRLRYGMRSLLELERRFGGLASIQQSISDDGTGAMIEPSLQLLCCGLLHEHAGNGEPFTPDRLAELLPTSGFQSAVRSAAVAMEQAFPTPAPAAPGAAAQTAPSPGPSGTTSAPSSSAGPTTLSGA